MRKAIVFAASVLLAVLAFAGSAAADSCTPLIQSQAQYLVDQKSKGKEFVFVTFHLTIHQNNGTVSYSEGVFGPGSASALEGDMKQYFNDRRTGKKEPYDPNQTDILGVRIESVAGIKSPDGTVAPSVSRLIVTLKSWGNSVMTYPIHCEGPFVLGEANNHQIVATFPPTFP